MKRSKATILSEGRKGSNEISAAMDVLFGRRYPRSGSLTIWSIGAL
jgi:hypothetical protein